MIRTIVIENNQLHELEKLPDIQETDNKWYWIDFNSPTEEEIESLHHPLQFHPLSIEDCIHTLQRPKLDYYENYNFYVIQALNAETFTREEVDFFVGDHYIVTFHNQHSHEVDEVWNRLVQSKLVSEWNPSTVLYHVLDKIVDNYFPLVYHIEDRLDEIDANSEVKSTEELLNEIFDVRHELLLLRHTITPMRDLTYRIINSSRLKDVQGRMEYFADIHDHLLKLAEMIEASRELTTDMRDSYVSLNSHQTNRVMKVLTVITTIFMPLTFIAGIYGMNFEYMPELHSEYGYYGTLLVMLVIGVGMFGWFYNKGWFK
ncbi:magnesium/cobalt transporter CorA [Bacillus sp. BGMRC 2118]|nr:magnesium/cobalt transporter CorA [Bacillus sp. BGMRC 2118]